MGYLTDLTIYLYVYLSRYISREIYPKENQLWIFIGRTDAEAKTPVVWPPVKKSRLIGKDSDAGKGWKQKEKGVAEDDMVI